MNWWLIGFGVGIAAVSGLAGFGFAWSRRNDRQEASDKTIAQQGASLSKLRQELTTIEGESYQRGWDDNDALCSKRAGELEAKIKELTEKLDSGTVVPEKHGAKGRWVSTKKTKK